MTQTLALAEVEAFLYAVAERYTEPAVLYLVGGIALRFLGHPRTTVDLDDVGSDLPRPTDRFATVLAEVATALQIEIEAVPIGSFVPLPPDADEQHIPVGQ